MWKNLSFGDEKVAFFIIFAMFCRNFYGREGALVKNDKENVLAS